MDLIHQLCEEEIKKAKREGAFDNLENKGKPLKLDDLSQVPKDLRTGYILLKNSGHLPEELELKKDMVNLEKLIESCHDEEEKETYRKRLNEKTLRFNFMLEKRGIKKSVLKAYKKKIRSNLGIIK
ncbi:DnaJ family domain-containing protein [Natranaerofaba carboxydovora]|uniref:DnaJ family domain-containing protein n=1 Tax=Natranaerofaba carboxydovora TaxID=2742683 RepID=UPI001F1387BA|nr:DnaJ family domain-containing protein [Natranaerofaba carboxydovora]UMZ72629.1 hypothetical protein ACONDI_00153 [Natranaerofaba carboxydovora]